MSLYEAEEPLVPMASAPMAPRSWQAMLVAWAELMATLAAIVGEKGPALDVDGLAAVIDRLHLLAWTWMWSLPPCSMARKATFELGRVATLIARWSKVPCVCGSLAANHVEDSWYQSSEPRRGLAAEEALRIAARVIGDARGEAEALGAGCGPWVPPHIRVYDHNGPRTIDRLAKWIMEDLFPVRHEHRSDLRGGRERVKLPRAASLANYETGVTLALSTLPENEPWLMTSEDAARFGRMVSEDIAT